MSVENLAKHPIPPGFDKAHVQPADYTRLYEESIRDPEGFWRREGKRLRSLFIFTNDAPDYSKRLDFTCVVQRVALERFQPEFEKAMAAMLARGGQA